MNKQSENINFEKLNGLQCYLLPGRGKRCIAKHMENYNKTYLFWKKFMIEAFLSEGLKEMADSLTSDSFVNYEECAVLFFKNEPIGLLMFDFMDFNFKSTFDLSYVVRYPKEIIDSLVTDSHRLVMTIGHLTVAPEWRKQSIGPGVSEIITGFMTRRFLESPASALLFLTRNNRGTDDLAYEHGGVALRKNFKFYGMPSDIVIMYPDSIKESKLPGIAELTNKLWSNKITGIVNPLHIFHK